MHSFTLINLCRGKGQSPLEIVFRIHAATVPGGLFTDRAQAVAGKLHACKQDTDLCLALKCMVKFSRGTKHGVTHHSNLDKKKEFAVSVQVHSH